VVSVITASANGSKALVAGSDGRVYVYDASVDTFTVSAPKDFTALGGAYAASLWISS